MKKVKIYTVSGCPWCKKTKELLDKKKVEYTEIDIKDNGQGNNEMVEKSGQMGVPVIDINGKIIVGFDEKEIEKQLS